MLNYRWKDSVSLLLGQTVLFSVGYECKSTTTFNSAMLMLARRRNCNTRYMQKCYQKCIFVSSCTFYFQHQEISQQDNFLRSKFIQSPNGSLYKVTQHYE